MRYLRRVTLSRPELQLVVSTHSGEMLSASKPEDIVVMRRTDDGERISRSVAALPLHAKTLDRVLRLTELHFDASRTAVSGAIAPVVEGVAGTVPLQRLGRPEEHAWLVAYLASPAGDYFSGAILTNWSRLRTASTSSAFSRPLLARESDVSWASAPTSR